MMTLEQWFQRAVETGVVYYTAKVSRTNMSADYSLFVVGAGGELERAWPDSEQPAAGGADYDEKLAKALGFRLSKRAWHCDGCGYDRVHGLISRMARHFGQDSKAVGRIRSEGLDV